MRALVILITLVWLSACSTMHAPAECGGDFRPVNLDEQSAAPHDAPVRC